MLSTALEQERLLLAGRLLSEIERRHGLPHPIQRELHPVIMDRFIAVYLPESREGERVPQSLEYAFAGSLTDALHLVRDVVSESPDGRGAAPDVHDLDIGVTADTREPHRPFPPPPGHPAGAPSAWARSHSRLRACAAPPRGRTVRSPPWPRSPSGSWR